MGPSAGSAAARPPAPTAVNPQKTATERVRFLPRTVEDGNDWLRGKSQPVENLVEQLTRGNMTEVLHEERAE
jgi:hypothetical protein